MRAYLDDQPLELSGKPGGQTLAAAMEAGKLAADAAGRMIIEVWADGAAAPGEHLEDPPADDPYAGELRFISVVPAELVSSAMIEAAENLVRVREPQQAAAGALARGETGEAMKSVAVCLQAWESARKAMQDGCAVLGVTPTELVSEADAPRVARAIDDLLSALRDVQTAVQNQDVATLADVLAYDLDELSDTWEQLLRSMAELAGRAPAGGDLA